MPHAGSSAFESPAHDNTQYLHAVAEGDALLGSVLVGERVGRYLIAGGHIFIWMINQFRK